MLSQREHTQTKTKTMQFSSARKSSQRAPPEGYIDNPSEVNELLQENALSINYSQLRDLTLSDKHDGYTVEIEDLPYKDLLKLSQQERNDITEEIHGVQNLCPEENPVMIDESLRRFAACLEEIPADQKTAYLRAQETYAGTYINDDEWRLRFLRCDLFDAEKAANRMVNFLDFLSDIFGDYVLKRHLQLTDFSWDEMQAFRRGHFQLLPYRDRSGRRVFTVVGGFNLTTPLTIRVRFPVSFVLVLCACVICVC